MNKEAKEVKRIMKQFNKVISVEVSVDSIANQLLNAMDDTNPHSVLITETIVGTLCAENRLGMLYNSLNGWEDTIDFKVGQLVHCSDTQYHGTKRQTIGDCKIVQIDKYRNGDQIEIEYEYAYGEENDKTSTDNKWVRLNVLSQPTTNVL